MIECKELAGRIFRPVRFYEDGPYGPEVSMAFEDGTTFTAPLHVRHVLEGKLTRDDAGEKIILEQHLSKPT